MLEVILVKKTMLFLLTIIISLFSFSSTSLTAETGPVTQESIDLRILETTDIHADLMNYDYYQTKIDNRIGLVKTATLIKEARKESKNTLLFDDGDHLKGNPLGEYLARIRGMKKAKHIQCIVHLIT